MQTGLYLKKTVSEREIHDMCPALREYGTTFLFDSQTKASIFHRAHKSQLTPIWAIVSYMNDSIILCMESLVYTDINDQN